MGYKYNQPPSFTDFFQFGENLTVKLDSLIYQEGELACGNVSFDLQREAPPFLIRLTLLGYEVVYWEYELKRNSTYYQSNRTTQCFGMDCQLC